MKHWSNFCNIKYNFTTFLPTLGYDLKIACAKFQGNWFIIDGEIDIKHELRTTKINVAHGIIILLIEFYYMVNVLTFEK